jgi:hypothetical protein
MAFGELGGLCLRQGRSGPFYRSARACFISKFLRLVMFGRIGLITILTTDARALSKNM